jgi:hypothetical protein
MRASRAELVGPGDNLAAAIARQVATPLILLLHLFPHAGTPLMHRLLTVDPAKLATPVVAVRLGAAPDRGLVSMP